MTAAPAAGMRAVGREGRRIRIVPQLRGRELTLLVMVGITLYVGSVSLAATERLRDQLLERGEPGRIDLATPANPGALITYVGALFLVHLAFVLAGRRTDQLLLPTVGMLGGIGLLLMERLPQDLAGNLAFGGLAETQLVWLLIALAIVTALALSVRNDVWLRRYKYTWAAVG